MDLDYVGGFINDFDDVIKTFNMRKIKYIVNWYIRCVVNDFYY